MPPAEQDVAGPRYALVRFCPSCGAAYSPSDFQAAEFLFLCSECGFDFYQNPLPSAVALVPHPGRAESVLVIRRTTPPGIGCWCLPGGFVRYGETPADAAVRESREEAGVRIEIGDVLHAGVVDYRYRGRSVCVVEIAFMATIAGALAEGATDEASEVTFSDASALLAAPGRFAFPEQLAVLKAYQARAGADAARRVAELTGPRAG